MKNRKLLQSLDSSESVVLYMDSLNYESFDSYDALLSPLSSILRSSLSQRVFIQGVKRIPLTFKPLLGIPKTRMVVNLAMALESSIVADTPTLNVIEEKLKAALLNSQKSDGGWGYEFDATLRWGSYTSQTSNLIATYFCVKALSVSGVEGLWKTKALEYLESQHQGDYFRYAGSNNTLIHNANLLGAVALDLVGGNRVKIQSSLESTLSAQLDSGGWTYGQGNYLSWIDNFHTCYVLGALLDLHNSGFDTQSSLRRGLEFWEANLMAFESPKYFYSDDQTTNDINTHANALQLMSKIHRSNFGQQFTRERIARASERLLDLVKSDKQISNSLRWKLAPTAMALAYSSSVLESQNE